MSIYTGQHGRLFHEKNASGEGGSLQEAAKVKNWQINMTQSMLEVTKLGDSWTDRLGGLKSITGTCELIYYRDDGKDGTPSELFDRFFQQTTKAKNYKLLFRLQQDGVNSDLSFRGLISSYTMNCTVGEVVSVQVTFESDGEPVKSNF